MRTVTAAQKLTQSNFELVQSKLNVSRLVEQLAAHPELWGQQAARLGATSPHYQSSDIWVRYRDLDEYRAVHGDDMRYFCDEHESVWLPPSEYLSEAKEIALSIAGSEAALGGVLITRLEPGKKIDRHVDAGWHAAAHDKYYVALQVRPGAVFGWDDGNIYALDGDVWRFRNDTPHWVINDSDEDRLSMIVCVKRRVQ